MNLLTFASSSFFLSLRKITWLYSQQPKTRGHVEHLQTCSWVLIRGARRNVFQLGLEFFSQYVHTYTDICYIKWWNSPIKVNTYDWKPLIFAKFVHKDNNWIQSCSSDHQWCVALNQKNVLPGLTYFGITTFWYSIVRKLHNRITQNRRWKFGQQTPSVGTILAYLETTA